MQFHTDDMSCSGCAQSIVRAVAGVDPAARTAADPATGRVEVASALPEAAIAAAIEGAGFRLRPVK